MAADLPDWLQRDDDEAIRFERGAVAELVARLRELVGKVWRDLAAAYVRLVGGVELPADLAASQELRRVLTGLLATVSTAVTFELPNLLAALRRLIIRGLALGVRQAQALFRSAADLVATPSVALSAIVERLAQVVPAQMSQALVLAGTAPIRTWGDLSTPLSAASKAVAQAEDATRWVANKAIAEGSAAVAELNGVGRMLISERSACLTCLAYSGEVAAPGEPFPAGLTFGKTSAVKEPFWSSPLHSSCRCRTVPWLGPGGSVDISTALKREAQRSVLRGDSAYDSTPARLRAARRLLDTGLVGTSEEAKRRAERAIAAGRFLDRGKTPRPTKTPRPRRPTAPPIKEIESR